MSTYRTNVLVFHNICNCPTRYSTKCNVPMSTIFTKRGRINVLWCSRVQLFSLFWQLMCSDKLAYSPVFSQNVPGSVQQ